MTPEIFWNVITETWPLVYNPLSILEGVKKEDISGNEIALIMTNTWYQQITYTLNYTDSGIIMNILWDTMIVYGVNILIALCN